MLNIHFFLSSMKNESRVEKEVKTLTSKNIFDEVIVFCYWKKGLKKNEKISPKAKIYRVALPSDTTKRRGFLKRVLAFYSLYLFVKKFISFCKENNPTTISVHNPILMPFAYHASKKNKAKLIYVPHELEIERTGLNGVLKRVTKFIEKKYIYKFNGMTVVCEPIKEWYKDYYKIKGIGVVPNIPYHPFIGSQIKKTKLFRDEFNISKEHIIFIYQGILSPGRGIKDLLLTFQNTKKDRHLVLMGYGELEDEIIYASKNIENIHFKPAVKPSEILNYTSSADVGLFFNSREMSLSYKYSMPNKFFEYAVGNLFIAVSSNFIEQTRVLKDNCLGTSIDPNIESLTNFVNSITLKDIATNLQESIEYRKHVSWSNNEGIIEDVYKNELILETL